jgi:hypothetical protein
VRIFPVVISLLFSLPAWAQAQGPGYGVVESVTPISRPAAEESASSGGSRPPVTKEARRKSARNYLVRVRMDDGSVQVRTVRRAEVRTGQRALITNAGDVVPE